MTLKKVQRKNVTFLGLFFFNLLIVDGLSVYAGETLPYTLRTKPYSGFSTSALGDTRTVGMGGATVGLADTFLAAATNPAGLAMTLNVLDTNITQNQIHDGNVQDYDQVIQMKGSLGVAVNINPWGFSIGILPTGKEGQEYLLPSSADSRLIGKRASIQTEAHELRLGVARVLFNNRLSLGMSLNIGIGEEEISVPGLIEDDRHGTTLGATLGMMYRLQDHILLGASYSMPMDYEIDSTRSPAFPGFFQPLKVPSRLEFGAGWIPNRLLRGSFQLSMIGKTEGTALLSDEARSVGSSVTFQPKLGLAYTFIDFVNFRAIIYGGSYYEVSRIEGANNRTHKTAGLEIRAWIFTTGMGIDVASNYQNFSYSIGVDLGTVLETARLIPAPVRPVYHGIMPSPIFISDDGLARPLVTHPQPPQGPDMSLITIISNIPDNTKKEVKRIKEAINGLVKPSAHPDKKKAKRSRKARPKKLHPDSEPVN